MSRSRREHGSAAIEVVALVPILILVALMTLQLGVAGWTASQTGKAAREAARAQSLGRNAESAAEAALPGALEIDEIQAGGDTVRLTVEIPRVSLLPQFRVTREVSIPRTLP